MSNEVSIQQLWFGGFLKTKFRNLLLWQLYYDELVLLAQKVKEPGHK